MHIHERASIPNLPNVFTNRLTEKARDLPFLVDRWQDMKASPPHFPFLALKVRSVLFIERQQDIYFAQFKIAFCHGSRLTLVLFEDEAFLWNRFN